MGCCNNQHLKLSEDLLISSIKQAIRQSATRRLELLLNQNNPSTGKPIDINQSKLIQADNMQLNIPAFAIITGNLKVFKFLSKRYKISIEKVNEIFDKYQTHAISVICLNGYVSFLEYYLPISLEFNSIDKSTNDVNTLNLSEPKEVVVNHTYTPIQLACIKGHINCINVILSYFKNKNPPWWLDINYIDPVYGENCALVSCKFGNFLIMRYLFSNTNADFHILNTNNENALQIFLSFAKRQMIPEQLPIVKFLIEEVKIDISHHIEETLLICDCHESLHYLHEKIKALGMDLAKIELETNFEIRQHSQQAMQKTIIMERSMESTIRDEDNRYSVNFSNVSKFL